MSTSMRRQLERLQADLDGLKPKPLRPVRLIARPGPDATEEQRKAYAEALAWSRAQGGPGVNLVILTPLEPTKREIVNSVSLNEYGRFDDLRGTIDAQRAKAYFDRIEGKSLPMFRVNIKAAKFLSDFLIRGVLFMNSAESDAPSSAAPGQV